MRYADSIISRAEPLRSLLKPGGNRNEGAPASFEDLEVAKEYVRRTAVGGHDPTGTCAMMHQGNWRRRKCEISGARMCKSWGV